MAESKDENIDKMLRKAAADKYGLGNIVEDVEKIKPFIEKVNTMQDLIKGDPGHSPVYGEDYMTPDEQEALVSAVTPQKGVHYFDGAPGQDGKTPEKGVDYMTPEEMAEITAKATPVKGVHYFTPDEVESFKTEITPKKGIDYNDGENPTPAQFLELIKGLKGKDAATFSQVVGSKIDISHVRNAGSFIFNGKTYKTEELMHGGGSGSGGSGTVTSVSIVTANGMAGSVANATTTPAVTLSTTVTGIVKGNGTAFSAAVANTDYQVPIILTTTGSSGPASFNGTTLNIPQYTGGSGGTPGTPDTSIQFNDGGSFGGDSRLEWDKTIGILYMDAAPGDDAIIETRDGASSGDNGISFDLIGGAGNGAADGASISLQAGTAGATSGTGGAVSLLGGFGSAAGGNGGAVTMQGGSGVTGGDGGGAYLLAGSGNGAGQGGNAQVIAGDSAGVNLAGGALIAGGAGGTTSNGGDVTLISGDGGSVSGDAGLVSLQGGDGTAGNANGGSIALIPGAKNGSGADGTINLQDSSLSGSSIGYVWTLANTGTGAGEWAASGGSGSPSSPTNSLQFNNSGSFGGSSTLLFNGTDTITFGAENDFGQIIGTNATVSGHTGAEVDIIGGAGLDAGNGGTVGITGGPGGATGAGGTVSILSGDGGATSGAGGTISVVAGNAQGGDDDGGPIMINAGNGDGTGQGGNVDIDGGQGGASNGGGGDVTMSAGMGGGSAAGGSAFVFGGPGGSTAGNGGLVRIQGGDATAGGSNGGSVDLIGGQPNGVGTKGLIRIKDGASTVFAILNTATLASTDKTFTFPNASGTIALTSDIPAAGANTALSNLASVAINTSLLPGTDDGAALGSTSKEFSDLFLASGGVINWANSNYTLTHSSNTLTANKDFRITSANVGTNADSVPTLSSTSTLTNKTLTAPVMTTVAETGIGTADLLAPNNHAITVTSNAGSASQSFLVNTFTNSSAATMAITIPVATPTPKDGQFLEVRIYDFSGVAQTIGWTNTENSTVLAPTTSNGSTTLPLSVLFQYNAATSKWRCVASC